MVEHHVDLVAGEFNGACWRRHKRPSTWSVLSQARRCSSLPPLPPSPGCRRFAAPRRFQVSGWTIADSRSLFALSRSGSSRNMVPSNMTQLLSGTPHLHTLSGPKVLGRSITTAQSAATRAFHDDFHLPTDLTNASRPSLSASYLWIPLSK